MAKGKIEENPIELREDSTEYCGLVNPVPWKKVTGMSITSNITMEQELQKWWGGLENSEFYRNFFEAINTI